MKESRRSKVITNAAEPHVPGVMGFLRRQANNILTVLLVIAAIVMLIRWRMRAAEAAKQAVNNQLLSAQSQVQQLREAQFIGYPPADLLKRLNFLESAANADITNVLNNSDADARMRAEAFIARGDLYWYLANLPPLPGSAKDPSLALGESNEALLQKSWDAYEEVLKNSTYADQDDARSIAHLAVGAINENRRDWAAARQEFDAVANDPKALAVLVASAKVQSQMISDLQEKLYVAPPEGTPAAPPTTEPSTMPVIGPATLPATMPATAPAISMPTTLPMKQIIQDMTKPATMPVKK